MKLAPQPLRCNSRAKPALPNLSTCAQCASIASAISPFRPLSKNCRAVSVSPSKSFRYRASDAKRHASKPFRINTCESVSKQSTLNTFRINTCEKQGGGGPHTFRVSSVQYPASRTICATWRLYPLWPQSIAHTSRHHGGVLPSSALTRHSPLVYPEPWRRAAAPEPIPCLTPSKALHYRAHLLQRRRFARFLACAFPQAASRS